MRFMVSHFGKVTSYDAGAFEDRSGREPADEEGPEEDSEDDEKESTESETWSDKWIARATREIENEPEEEIENDEGTGLGDERRRESEDPEDRSVDSDCDPNDENNDRCGEMLDWVYDRLLELAGDEEEFTHEDLAADAREDLWDEEATGKDLWDAIKTWEKLGIIERDQRGELEWIIDLDGARRHLDDRGSEEDSDCESGQEEDHG